MTLDSSDQSDLHALRAQNDMTGIHVPALIMGSLPLISTYRPDISAKTHDLGSIASIRCWSRDTPTLLASLACLHSTNAAAPL